MRRDIADMPTAGPACGWGMAPEAEHVQAAGRGPDRLLTDRASRASWPRPRRTHHDGEWSSVGSQRVQLCPFRAGSSDREAPGCRGSQTGARKIKRHHCRLDQCVHHAGLSIDGCVEASAGLLRCRRKIFSWIAEPAIPFHLRQHRRLHSQTVHSMGQPGLSQPARGPRGCGGLESGELQTVPKHSPARAGAWRRAASRTVPCPKWHREVAVLTSVRMVDRPIVGQQLMVGQRGNTDVGTLPVVTVVRLRAVEAAQQERTGTNKQGHIRQNRG